MRSVGVFVDCVDQFYSIGRIFQGRKLSYARYLEIATELSKGEILRAFAYGVHGETEPTGFITALKIFGYEPKYQQARIVDGQYDIQGTFWHVGIFADILRILDRIDTVVLGSSDLDLIPMLDYIRERGVKVILLSCDIPKELKFHSDLCHEINADMLEKPNAVAQAAK